MIFAFGDFELDTRVYELRHAAGGPRPLEPQVFDVLAYLVQHRDRVVSKEELLEKLWPDRFVSETTLTSRLKEVRKAVGDTGRDQTIIRTLHGRGYRFVAPVEERTSSLSTLVGCVAAEHVLQASVGAPLSPAVSPLTGQAVVLDLPAVPAERRIRDDFVGRAAELEKLTIALHEAERGDRQVVLLAGEAGAGKTTLVETFLSSALHTPWRVARGQCVEHRGSGEPYMPLLEALARLCREPDGGAVLDALRREAPSWLVQLPSLLPESEHAGLVARTGTSGERMLREFGLFAERLTAERPLLLLLEDLHWSDYATLDVLDLLARQPGRARLLLLGTFRPADVKAARHPMHAIAQELRVRGYCQVMPVSPLVPPEVDEYLVRRFPAASFHAELAGVLHARTAGNPLFVENLVDSWLERGLIRHDGDEWVLDSDSGALETDVPETLHHFIEKQVSELDPGEQQLLEVASVFGRTFSVAAVASALPGADEDIERRAETFSREGRFLRADGAEPWGDGAITSRFSFTHDLFVDVLYRRIPAARRARLHLQAGHAIERAWSGRDREHVSALALHFRRGGDRERGPKYLQRAAEQALERSAYREAVDHLSAALDLLADSASGADRDRMELALLCRLAPCLIATRGYADARVEQNYVRARELAERLGDTVLLSQTLYGLANMYEYRGAYEVAEQVVSERLAIDGATSSVNLMESHELLTCSFLHQGRYRESVEHGEKAMAAVAGGPPPDGEQLVLLVQAHGWMSFALHFAGRGDAALAHNAEALRLADASGDDLARASAAIQAAFTRYHRGEPEEAAALAQRGAAIARERRFPFHSACGSILLGWNLALQGRPEEAVRQIHTGIALCRSIGALMDLPLFLAILADALDRSGDRPAALATLDEALAIVESGRTFFYEPELIRLRALLRYASGQDREVALDSLRKAHALAEAQGSPVLAERAAASVGALEAREESPRAAPRAARRAAGRPRVRRA
jgi:DNA-binding winged helix-turn-helix (wHTH) protein/tetratricopeptide (TPR) repeat protein/type II secretory pathway predicted ATPase ExeA